ncbi:ArsR family transcriptional regulator [Ignicoccus islandicus DSM 13165]|uniref:ArsR family transcriptional regulator n=1 Tax=Ignicoccus islandicus DSM 13165 TaxID=940295 RepID=A0A0U3E7H0_9CREN|nr:helix-turn-helix domain-containing protein [Ignicoccus islandicus]ALU11326.1 ArsR family transcriptional regulator [Ignicoccus islandicus DSM 13165]
MSSKLFRRPTVVRAILLLQEEGELNLNALAKRLGTNRHRLKKYLDELSEYGIVEKTSNTPAVYKLKVSMEEILKVSSREMY